MNDIRPGSGVLNFLSTDGRILNPEHIALCTAITKNIVGSSKDEARDKHISARLGTLGGELFSDVAQDWIMKHPADFLQLGRRTMALLNQQSEEMPTDATLMDTWVDFNTRCSKDSTFEETKLAEVGADDDVIAFLNDPKNKLSIEQVCYSFMTEPEMPTLSEYRDLFRVEGKHNELDRFIADMLDPWCSGGNGPYAGMLDGESTIKVGGLIDYFNFSPVNDDTSFNAIMFFITLSKAKNHIISLPRDVPKRVFIDEGATVLNFHDGPELFRLMLREFRRYNCWITITLTDLEALAEKGVLGQVLGNTRMLFIMKSSRRDLNLLDEFVDLPEHTKKQISSFPDPNRSGHAHFCYIHLSDEGDPMIIPASYRASREMLVCGGGCKEEISKKVLTFNSTIEGIVQCAKEL